MPSEDRIRYLGLIPARAGSKGIPGKNVVELGGRPLIRWTIDAALASERLDHVLLSSDDEDAMQVARDAGVDVPFSRPAELAEDRSSMVDVVLHAVDFLSRRDGVEVETVVLLQPTSPFRNSGDVDVAVAAFEAAGADRLVSVSPPHQHPCDMVEMSDGGLTWAVPHPDGAAGRQDFPRYFFVNGAIYITRLDALRRDRVFESPDSAVHVMDPSHSVDIDDELDLALARGLLLAES